MQKWANRIVKVFGYATVISAILFCVLAIVSVIVYIWFGALYLSGVALDSEAAQSKIDFFVDMTAFFGCVSIFAFLSWLGLAVFFNWILRLLIELRKRLND